MSYYLLDPFLFDSDRRIGQSHQTAHPSARHAPQYRQQQQQAYFNPRSLFATEPMTYPYHPSEERAAMSAPKAPARINSQPRTFEDILWPLMEHNEGHNSNAATNWTPSIFSKGHGQPLSMTCNFAESENDFVVTADLPGVTANDIQVSILTDPRGGEKVLVVKAERKHRQEEDNSGDNGDNSTAVRKVKKSSLYHYVETSYGMIQRTFRLPENVNTDNIKCQLDHGVLTVVVNKNKSGPSSSVPINNVGKPAQQPSVDNVATVDVEDVNEGDDA
jgi:HSP20 family molecular chaperone IbpA